MKTKLLKKVRKRFSIVHYPKGYLDDNVHKEENTITLYDEKLDSEFFPHRESVVITSNPLSTSKATFHTEKEAINFLMKKIIATLRREGHKQRKDIELKKTYKKVWYVGN
jgi:hypothetical protein